MSGFKKGAMEFDLTSVEGFKKALEFFNKYGVICSCSSQIWLLKMAWDVVSSLVSSRDIIQEQRKTAVELIKAGRDAGVDEMKITLDQMAGIDIGADIESIPFKVKVGKNGKMTLEVKYKNA